MAKVTPWFPCHVLPIRIGVYEIQAAGNLYRFFDGAKWHMGASSITTAHNGRHTWLVTNNRKWRGLAKEPK